MVIRVLDHKYFVLRTIDSEDGLKQYVCRDLVDEESDICRIVCIPHADVTAKLLRYLADIEVEGSFKELREYASEGDYLCVVMDCGSKNAVPIAERIAEEEPPLKEKLGYVYKLIERMILSNIPAYFAAAALTCARVKFSPALDCSFDFDIHDILDYERYSMNDVCSGLAEVVLDVFDKELRWNSMPELTDFIKNLQYHRYSDYLDMFGDFKQIVQKYIESDEAETESNSFPFRLWDVIKDFASQLRNLSALLLVILAVVYLVISIRNHMKPTVAQDVYSSIGDMQIVGTGSPAEELSAAAKADVLEATSEAASEAASEIASAATSEAASVAASASEMETGAADTDGTSGALTETVENASAASGDGQQEQGGDRS